MKIAIICDKKIFPYNYVRWVKQAGLEPVVVQRMYQFKKLKNVSGGIFIGGGDIKSCFYSCKNIGKGNNWYRDVFDYKAFLDIKQKALLGICRGAQIINVFLGGTLKDLKDEYMHIGERDIYHVMKSNKKEIIVNSMHHQAIEKLAKGFVVLGKADDVVEFALGERYILCQFHPERMNCYFPLIYLKKVIKKAQQHIIK